MLFAFSLVALAVFGLGYPVSRWLARRGPLTFTTIGVSLGVGLTTGFMLGLVSPSLRSLSRLGIVLALPGLVLLVRDAMRQGRAFWRETDAGGWLLSALLGLVALVKALAEPLTAWDARSIWFFHAKIVFFADRILDAQAWSAKALAWSHVDYPKLNAFWSAVWTSVGGAWNEHLPKGSLVLLLLPAVFLCLGFSRGWTTRALLLALLVLRFGEMLWIGYMDGLLATYAGLGLLYGIRYILRGESFDLVAMIVAAGVCAGLKNEGMVVAGLLLAATALGRKWHARSHSSGPRLQPGGALSALVLAMLPALVWHVWTRFQGFANDLTAAGGLARLSARLEGGGATEVIWRGLFGGDDFRLTRLLSLLTLAYWLLNRRAISRVKTALAPALAVPLVYALVLLLVYLSSPYDPVWHLQTSVSRTRMTLLTLFDVAMIGVLIAAGPGRGHSQRDDGISKL